MFQLFKGKRNEKRSLKLPANLSRKDQKRVQEVIDRAKKDDGIPRTAQQSIPFDHDIRQTTSYELQKKYYEDFVRRHPNWTLVKIYADEGIAVLPDAGGTEKPD